MVCGVFAHGEPPDRRTKWSPQAKWRRARSRWWNKSREPLTKTTFGPVDFWPAVFTTFGPVDFWPRQHRTTKHGKTTHDTRRIRKKWGVRPWWGPGGWAPNGGAPKSGEPKISRFFPSPATIFFLSSLSWGPFVEFWWCLKGWCRLSTIRPRPSRLWPILINRLWPNRLWPT